MFIEAINLGDISFVSWSHAFTFKGVPSDSNTSSNPSKCKTLYQYRKAINSCFDPNGIDCCCLVRSEGFVTPYEQSEFQDTSVTDLEYLVIMLGLLRPV
jgi:hypothetical protein